MNNENLRGYNDIIILNILMSADSYGYEISKTIAEKSQSEYVIKEATLYSALNRLEKLGLIISYSGKESGGSPRTYYQITQTGRQYYSDKKQQWDEAVSIMKKLLGGGLDE